MRYPQRRQNSRVFAGLGTQDLNNTKATHQEQRKGLKNYLTSPYLGIQPRAISQCLHLLVKAIGIYRDDKVLLYLFCFKTASY
jgi:hypothetical protein